MGADRSALTALGVVAALLVALVATTSGGLRPVSLPHHVSPQNSGSSVHRQSSGGSQQSNGGANQQPASPSDSAHGLGWLPTWSQLVLIAVLAMIVFTLLAIFRVRLLRRHKLAPSRTRAVTPAVDDQEPDDVPESFQALLDDQLSGLDEGTPRNAIVAAWVQLEEFATSHGLPRDPADTPAEFVERALATYDLDGGALQRLADLYREARFSTHPLQESHRAEARACLEHLTTGVSL